MTPEQMELIVRNALGAEVNRFLALALALAALVSLAASYFGSYLQSKGAHRALREELDTLTKQVAATTRAAEEIKTQIGQAAWIGQKRWELKRELYTDLMQALYRTLHINETAFDLYMRSQSAGTPELQAFFDRRVKEVRETEREHVDEIIRVRGIGELILSADTVAALDDLERSWARSQDAPDMFQFLEARVAGTRTGHARLVVTAKADLELDGGNNQLLAPAVAAG